MFSTCPLTSGMNAASYINDLVGLKHELETCTPCLAL